MASLYSAFLMMLVPVAILGSIGIPKRLGIGRRALERENALITIITAMTAAGLLSLSFLADKFASTGGSLPLLESSDLNAAALAVIFLLLTCISGLLGALIGLVIVKTDGARRWAGGCLALSSLAAVLLSPAVITLILAAADATIATGSA